MAEDLIAVTGAGGFIGGHLVRTLVEQGRPVRAIDIKPPDRWHQRSPQADERVLDLSLREACFEALDGAAAVYNLAADMGGIGFIERNKAACMLSVLINTHLLLAARDLGVGRFFYASSACVYNVDKQRDPAVVPLREADAYPAMPEDGYGWEKLFCERMCHHFHEDYGLATRVARLFNVYGPNEVFAGGREKAPAAICRKVARAKLDGDHRIAIWGDGRQTRNFTYIADCIEGIQRIMAADHPGPINLGSDELVTIDGLVDLVAAIAGVELERSYLPDEPTGVRGRNSDNSLIQQVLGWAPATRLRDGLQPTYAWIEQQLRAHNAGR